MLVTLLSLAGCAAAPSSGIRAAGPHYDQDPGFNRPGYSWAGSAHEGEPKAR